MVLFLGWPDPTARLTAMGLSSSASLCAIPIPEPAGMKPLHIPVQRGEFEAQGNNWGLWLPLFIRLELVTEIY